MELAADRENFCRKAVKTYATLCCQIFHLSGHSSGIRTRLAARGRRCIVRGMRDVPAPQITGLLVEWSNGNQAALDEMLPLIEGELRRLAHHYMRRERPGHTLQTT